MANLKRNQLQLLIPTIPSSQSEGFPVLQGLPGGKQNQELTYGTSVAANSHREVKPSRWFCGYDSKEQLWGTELVTHVKVFMHIG